MYNIWVTAITAPIIPRFPQLRPLNIVRDLPRVADLVEKCFADTMDEEGRNYIQQIRRAGQDNVFLRWASNAVETVSMPLSGYVWEENGEIIGNVSVIPHRQARKKYYLIANVAVRPEFRNRGIGRELTLSAVQHASQHHADEIWLQVRDDNPSAIKLYRGLGFEEHARRTTWQTHPDRNAKSMDFPINITRRFSSDWPLQEGWLRQLYPELLSWYQPIPWNSLRPGLFPAIYRFLSDDDVRQWAARTGILPSAVVSWQAMAGGNNRLWVAIPPGGNGEILTVLLQHTRRELFLHEKILFDFPAGEYNEAIKAGGFHPLRTLLWMKVGETLQDETRKSI